MKTLKIVLGAVALALMSSTSFATTPTPIASATQTPAAAASPSPVTKANVGTSANFLKFFAAGTCTVDPAAFTEGNSAIYTCTVSGAKTTDVAFVQTIMPNTLSSAPALDRDCFYVQGSQVTAADTIAFRIVNRDNGPTVNSCNPGNTTFAYLVLRPNPGLMPR